MFLEERGYVQSGRDKRLFVLTDNKGVLLVQLHGENVLYGSTNQTLVQAFVELITREFEVIMYGVLKYMQGVQIKQTDEGISMSQDRYTRTMLEKFELDAQEVVTTPMKISTKLTADERGGDVNVCMYQGMIERLQFLTMSRPDICYAVNACAQYQVNPKMSHLSVVRRILKYVNGTPTFELYYTKDTDNRLKGYCAADWAGSLDNIPGSLGGCYFIGNNMVSWKSMKQNNMPLSTAEAELNALESSSSQIVRLKQLTEECGMISDFPILYCNNHSAIHCFQEPARKSRTMHIDHMHNYIHELVKEKLIAIEHVGNKAQLVNVFIKPLISSKFCTLRMFIGMFEL
ncbi:putative RNA-directed DNA polymerase [Arabidopsis thaliana]